MTTHAHDTHEEHKHAPEHGEYVPPTGWHRWTYPGWLRILWCAPLFGVLGTGLVCLIRWLADWAPVWKGVPIVTVVGTPLKLRLAAAAARTVTLSVPFTPPDVAVIVCEPAFTSVAEKARVPFVSVASPGMTTPGNVSLLVKWIVPA